jgi:hypothetical protein
MYTCETKITYASGAQIILNAERFLKRIRRSINKMDPYIHSVPGRLRVKVPMIRHQKSKGQKILALLENLDGIDQTTVNTLTGSVVINYDDEIINVKQILDILKRHNYFDASMALSMDKHIQKAATKAGQKFGRAAFGWAVGKALEANGMSFLAAFI